MSKLVNDLKIYCDQQKVSYWKIVQQYQEKIW